MNESEDTKYGKCRCCSSTGYHRNLMLEYKWDATSEVYIKMFLECFNLHLSIKTKKGTLICASCIVKLRDAFNFKKMVLEAERSMLDYDTIKKEDPKEQSQPERKSIEINIVFKKEMHDDFSDYSETGKNDGDSDELPDLDTDKSTVPEITYKIQKYSKTEKLRYIHNSLIILENSNVAPFKAKYQNGFPCFYCRTKFKDEKNLRDHQKIHRKEEIKTVFRSYRPYNFLFYVDITDLKCTICNEDIPDLNNLKAHLIAVHQKKFKKGPDLIIPFKLTPNKLECQICRSIFGSFGALERHMNVHFAYYVCKDCGKGFPSKNRLKMHSEHHDVGNFECEKCKKVFSSQAKLKNHVNFVHNKVKPHLCGICDERFTDYSHRQKHMVKVHGATPVAYNCNACDKSFDKKILLSYHIKRYHLEQKDYQCDVCPYSCFGKAELKGHMVKHSGEKIFECLVCKKSFARKKALIVHMRIHNNDRRHACKACGQAFVQTSSLKSHIKTHHPDLMSCNH